MFTNEIKKLIENHPQSKEYQTTKIWPKSKKIDWLKKVWPFLYVNRNLFFSLHKQLKRSSNLGEMFEIESSSFLKPTFVCFCFRSKVQNWRTERREHQSTIIGSSPELSAFAASCRFRKVAWILVLQIPALLVQNKTHMVNMDEAPNFHKMLKPELKLNTCEAMVQKLLARKLLLFRCSMMASLVLFSLF